MSKPTDLSRQKLTRVFSTDDELEARMIQELLRNAGIESIINAGFPPGIFPMKMGELAQQDIFVLESEASQAQQIISEQHKSNG
ncbi:MAG: DUF2007 domain-containing protein [Acidobacteria bacterium]|nr:DUF2007 domain-containing protein [Acidobacteriota bacterium]